MATEGRRHQDPSTMLPAPKTGLAGERTICEVSDCSAETAPRYSPEVELQRPTLSTRQVSQLLAIGEATVKRLTDSGALSCFHHEKSGSRRFALEDPIAYLRKKDLSGEPAPPLAAAGHSLSRFAISGEVAGAVAVVLELCASGVPLERIIDAYLSPVIDEASHGFIQALAERIAALGDPRIGRAQPVAVIVPVGHPAESAIALIVAMLRSRGFEVLRPVDSSSPREAVQVALRSRARIVAFLFSGDLLADTIAAEALSLAAEMAIVLQPGRVCAYGPRLRALPAGVLAIRSMEDLCRVIDGK